MKHSYYKLITVVMSLVILVLPASCGKNQEAGEITSADSASISEAAGGSAEKSGFEKFKGVTLSYWLPFSSTLIKSLDENIVYQEMEKKTGIKIEFINPPVGQETDNFNLLVSSGDLPDIIYDQGYKGGGNKAIEDNVYIKLNDKLEEYAPNYLKVMDLNPEIARQCKEDDGTIWSFQCIQLDREPAYIGPAIRQDYLDKVGLKMPETIDDWTNVLTAFRDELKLESPIVFPIDACFDNSGVLSGTYGASTNFLNKDGKVVYGPIEPGFKDFLSTMNKWYKDGLLDRDFATRDSKSLEAQITSGKTGGNFAALYGAFSVYQSAGKATDPQFNIVAAPYPVLNPGDDPSKTLHIRQKNEYVRTGDRAISTHCKNVEAAMRWLDYGYTDEGYMLFNYGIEGTTYTWEDGETEKKGGPTFFPPSMTERIKKQHPQFTDLLIKNPDGIDFWTLIDKYKVHYTSCLRNPMSYYNEDNVYEAMDIWSRPGDDYIMPAVSLTDSENKAMADILNKVDTYRKEMMAKFIIGEEPISNFEKYAAQIKELGIEDAIKIQQDALERYKNR